MDIGFRPFTRADYPLLARWRRDRAWLTWWGPAQTVDELEEYYGPVIDGDDPTIMSIATLDGQDIGLTEQYRIADHPEWDAQVRIEGAAGIDYGIGLPEHRGRGVGTAMLTALVADTFDEFHDCTSVVAAPKSANRASCGVLERIGMELVRVEHLKGEYPEEGDSSIYVMRRTAWEAGEQ